MDEKKEEIASLLPRLNSLFKTEKEVTEVEVIKGKNTLRTIYNDIFKVMIKTKEPLYVLGVEESKFLECDEIAIKQHILRIRENNLKEKLIARAGAKTFFEDSQSEYRLIPDKLFNPNPTHIYGDNVAMIIWGRPTYGIIIRSRQVADTNRKYFKMLWKMAKV